MELLNVSHLKKVYTTRFGGTQVQALSDVNFSVEEGEFVAIMGESGSGKTTLLNILATLDKPTAGEVLLSGVDMGSIPEKQLAMYRRNNLGFVFQDFLSAHFQTVGNSLRNRIEILELRDKFFFAMGTMLLI